eukprot:scaffold73131_cov25-Phaeocystis_antarctica.AAC.1
MVERSSPGRSRWPPHHLPDPSQRPAACCASWCLRPVTIASSFFAHLTAPEAKLLRGGQTRRAVEEMQAKEDAQEDWHM